MDDTPPELMSQGADSEVKTRSYQQEMLDASLTENIIIAQDTGSGKTLVAVLRIKIECTREPHKVSWFIAPTVALCEQQHDVIQKAIGSAGLIHGGLEPKQWTDPNLWKNVLSNNRVIVSTPQVLLDALSHGYVNLGRDIGLLIFDEAHHANRDHPMNCIMRNFYFKLPIRKSTRIGSHETLREERPMILGLTASPMFGGNAAMAFRTLETNLDSVIRSPRQHRDELEAYVHRPVFRHVLYSILWKYNTCFLASKNFVALKHVMESMDIEKDPYVLSLRKSLAKTPPGPERIRLDQKLSKTILKNDTYAHKGIKDLFTTAHDISYDLGPWATDWYIQRVVEMALANALDSPYGDIMPVLQARDKAYLIDHLKKIDVTPVSYDPQAIENGISHKLQVLLQTLEEEKERAESANEAYSGILFVTRRDAVLALAAILENHPRTKESFKVGCLLGTSESSSRTTFLDITRKILRQPQADTLDDFKSGEKNLIVATAVAEEGLDIQACGNVIRWDVPNNMASWVQSRGRARRKRSSFVLMFESGGVDDVRIAQFEKLEWDMVAQYNAERMAFNIPQQLPAESGNEFEACEFRVESTGALLTLQAAVSHLNHFCSLLPNSSHNAIYDIDPPDLPEGWHALDQALRAVPVYHGPFGCTLTLPKAVPRELRVYTVERIHPSKRLAYHHVAFKAYVELYKAGLLNDHLLPLPNVDPELDQEVQNMLKDIERRDGTASVTSQLNPWLLSNDEEIWWSTEIIVEGLPSLTLLTRVEIPTLDVDEVPVLHHPERGKIGVNLAPGKMVRLSQEELVMAQECTRMLFWSLHGTRMSWSHLDFAYLFIINADPDADTWLTRRGWAMKAEEKVDSESIYRVNVDAFVSENGYHTDFTWVRDRPSFGKLYRFVGWHHDRLTEEEEAEICARSMYSRYEQVRVTYPLLIVESLPPRSNFLLPLPVSVATRKPFFLLTKYAYFELLSPTESEYTQFIPSILRRLETAMIVKSFRNTIFPSAPLANIPTLLLTTAMTAPVAEDQGNYERLETLGDAVLKFIVALHLMATYPLWHEGYLSRRKDHVVANSCLAKMAIQRSIFRWIIRTRFSPRRFRPLYLSAPKPGAPVVTPPNSLEEKNDEPVVGGGKTRKEVEELSTKMLADVVESLIGASYLHGGFGLGVSCAKLFGLGLEWHTLEDCVEKILSRVEHTDEVATQMNDVERMVGYTFRRKLLLVESLTHASCQYDDRTVSYERMEFLGDALLDMVVADFLYRYPGKDYSPHHIHIRKSAVVNTHFLAYICLRTALEVDASLPGPGPRVSPTLESRRPARPESDVSPVYKVKDEIETALATGKMFPWAALTRLQAPKLFSDMVESLIGAVYLDSEGNMDAVKALLQRLGVLSHLDRIVRDDVDVLHPVSRLSVWASRKQKEINYEYSEERGLVTCTIVVEGYDPVSASADKRGHASKEEARFAAAEKAIAGWEVQ